MAIHHIHTSQIASSVKRQSRARYREQLRAALTVPGISDEQRTTIQQQIRAVDQPKRYPTIETQEPQTGES